MSNMLLSEPLSNTDTMEFPVIFRQVTYVNYLALLRSRARFENPRNCCIWLSLYCGYLTP